MAKRVIMLGQIQWTSYASKMAKSVAAPSSASRKINDLAICDGQVMLVATMI
ncbi:hypothetical protein ACEWPM_014680 [Roseovarius sp. S4756]|uniref:hypothetical protein n=1 Tax=Roseovarius maritimus TaxID=3342637 RepID=UPI003729263E